MYNLFNNFSVIFQHYSYIATYVQLRQSYKLVETTQRVFTVQRGAFSSPLRLGLLERQASLLFSLGTEVDYPRSVERLKSHVSFSIEAPTQVIV